MLNDRKSIYEKSDITIDTDKTSVGKSVDILAKIITKNVTVAK